MKDVRRELVLKFGFVKVDLKVVGLSAFLAVLLMSPAFFIIQFPAITNYFQVPWWAEGMVGMGVLLIAGSMVALEKFFFNHKRKRTQKPAGYETMNLEVLDRFTFIKVLPGEEGQLEFRYFVKTTAGNWQLAENKLAIFFKLRPGMFIRAAVIKENSTKEILDLEILTSAGEETAPGTRNQVMDKAASEVNITGYRAGKYLVNKWQWFKEVKYYLVVNNKVLPVTGAIFSRTRVGQSYN